MDGVFPQDFPREIPRSSPASPRKTPSIPPLLLGLTQSADGSKEEILENISSLENKEKANIITGDMNICALRERKGLLVTALTEKGYSLLTRESTHVKGRQIDHVYVKNATASLDLYTPYYSDHDALCGRR